MEKQFSYKKMISFLAVFFFWQIFFPVTAVFAATGPFGPILTCDSFSNSSCVDTDKCTGTPKPDATGCPTGQVCCVGGGGGSSGGGLTPCGNQTGKDAAEDCNFEKLIDLAKAVIDFLLFKIAMPLAAISFAWAGWLYMSAMGNESKVSEAHRIFGYVVLGLCLALAAWLIVNAILSGLGVKDVFNSLKGGWGTG